MYACLSVEIARTQRARPTENEIADVERERNCLLTFVTPGDKLTNEIRTYVRSFASSDSIRECPPFRLPFRSPMYDSELTVADEESPRTNEDVRIFYPSVILC